MKCHNDVRYHKRSKEYIFSNELFHILESANRFKRRRRVKEGGEER